MTQPYLHLTVLTAIRLIGELFQEGEGFTDDQLRQLSESTDMTTDEIHATAERISLLWDTVKSHTGPGAPNGTLNAGQMTELIGRVNREELDLPLEAVLTIQNTTGYLITAEVTGTNLHAERLADSMFTRAPTLAYTDDLTLQDVTGAVTGTTHQTGTQVTLYFWADAAAGDLNDPEERAHFDARVLQWVQGSVAGTEATVTGVVTHENLYAARERFTHSMICLPEPQDLSEPPLIAVPLTPTVLAQLEQGRQTNRALPSPFGVTASLSRAGFILGADNVKYVPGVYPGLPREMTEGERDNLSTGLGLLTAEFGFTEVYFTGATNDVGAPTFDAGRVAYTELNRAAPTR